MEVRSQGYRSLGKRRGGVLARLSPRQRAGFFSDLSNDFHFFTVQWITRIFLPKLRKRSIAWALSFALYSVIFLHVAESNAQTPDYTQQLRDIDNSLTLLNNTLGNMWNPSGPLLSEAEYDYRVNQLVNILSYGQSVGQNNNILTILKDIKANTKAANALASNPWWATNSGFTLTKGTYTYAFPDEPTTGSTGNYLYSFPQFMSKWSSYLTMPLEVSSTISTANLRAGAWRDWFGTGRFSGSVTVRNPYTWFDWVSDAMRSNWVASSTSRSLVETSPSDIEDIVTDDWNTYSEPLETDSSTNSVPEFEIEIPNAPNIDPFTSAATELHSALPSSGNGSPVITVIPAFSFGSVHTPSGSAPLGASNGTDATTPFYNAVHLVSSWAWKLIGFLCVFFIVKHEYNFWTTLGGSASE